MTSISYTAFKSEQALISKKTSETPYSVNRDIVNSIKYYNKFAKLPVNKDVCKSIYKEAGNLLEKVDGKDVEYMTVINRRTGKHVTDNFSREALPGHTGLNKEEYNEVINNLEQVIVLHNHSSNRPPSGRDIATQATNEKIYMSIILCHDGDVFAISSTTSYVGEIYERLFKYFNERYEINIARTLATMELEKINKVEKLYEIWRL